MKILSPITENQDLVDKEYVDNHSGEDVFHWFNGLGWYALSGLSSLDGVTVSYQGMDMALSEFFPILYTYAPDAANIGALAEIILTQTTIPSELVLSANCLAFSVDFPNKLSMTFEIQSSNNTYSISSFSVESYGVSNRHFKYTATMQAGAPVIQIIYEGQSKLVSGTNIKTINNQSLLGSGNISISGGSSTDVQVNGTSITSNNVANLVTNTAYNASSNKIATMSDLPSVPVTDVKVNNSSVVSSGVVDLKTNTAYNASSNKLATMSDIPSVPVTDIKINNTSILSNGSANIVTNTAYNASSNKIATMSDVPSVSDRLKIYARSGYNLNTCYDAGVYLVAQGSNIPSGSNYGSLLVMPYRKAEGNTTPDFGTQIFMPNGDDNTHPNSFYYRTALSGSWNSWQELETTTNKVTSISSSSTDAQYPSAKCVYDIIGDIESLLGGI